MLLKLKLGEKKMEICLLGTGGMLPLPQRFLASCYVEQEKNGILIDCGEGTQVAFQKTGYDLSKLNIILITHWHADHIMGLTGLLLTLGNHLKRTPLHIVGAKGIKEVVSHIAFICKFLPYDIEFIELEETKQIIFENLKITAFPLFHPVPCFGYSMKLKEKDIYFKLSYCTDTRPTEAMEEIRDSDLFICEGMYGKEEQYENAVRKRHLLFSEAAQIAKKYCVKELWLTHFSQTLLCPEEYLNNAEKIFSNTKIGKDFMKKIIIEKNKF